MTTAIKVEATTTDRTEAEAARAAPVSLPAGSYDLAELTKGLAETSKAKHDDNRDEMVAELVAKANQTALPADTMGVEPGYKRVAVDDQIVGVTEQRVVFDPKQREEAEAAQENYQPAVDPAKVAAAADTKGE